MAAEAIVSTVLEQLTSIIAREIDQEVRLVVGVKKEVDTLTTKFLDVKAVLDDAEKRQLKDDLVKRWMCKLKDISYDMEDVLDEWSTAIRKELIKGNDDENFNLNNNNKKVCFLFLTCFRCVKEVGLRHDIAVKVKKLNKRFDDILRDQLWLSFRKEAATQAPELPRTTTSLIDVAEVKGRNEEKYIIINKLLNESSETPELHITSIVGMGGIGKTTLASLVYNDSAVKAHFDDRIWVCVSDPFDEIRVAKAILESLSYSAPNLIELQTILQNIQQTLKDKKFLLVLDDVWEEKSVKWEHLKLCFKSWGSAGSKILVTTRKVIAARAIGCNDIYPIGQLSRDDSWLLFSKIAFHGWSYREQKQFEDVGRKIESKCKGLPLAVKTLASSLCCKRYTSEWQSILDSEVWELDIAEVDLFPHLWLSYYDLPPELRRCFSYCAIFPKDSWIQKDELIKSWTAHGYLRNTPRKDMETLGEEYFQNLASRSFFQEFRKSFDVEMCKMHDIVHDFSLYITRNEVMRGWGPAFSGKAYHSRIELSEEASSSSSSCPSSVKKLRSLDIIKSSSTVVSHVLPDLIIQLTCLRSLDLSHIHVEKIPSTINQLIHLRRLDLSDNPRLKLLPETLGELYNLLTLDISHCFNLEKLPRGIVKLHNLRHLHNLNFGGKTLTLPKGIARLTRLRALDMVNVVNGDHEDAFTLVDLEKLNMLRGDLRILGLGNVSASGAAGASLKNKLKMARLYLWFDGDHEADDWRAGNDEDLIQMLEPSPELEGFSVFHYQGKSFSPTWMLSLTHLKDLTLKSLKYCEHLPPELGNLPCLESIQFLLFTKLKRLGVEFWRIHSHQETASASTSTSASVSAVASPKLRNLCFHGFDNWDEWDDHEMKKKMYNSNAMPGLFDN